MIMVFKYSQVSEAEVMYNVVNNNDVSSVLYEYNGKGIITHVHLPKSINKLNKLSLPLT